MLKCKINQFMDKLKNGRFFIAGERNSFHTIEGFGKFNYSQIKLLGDSVDHLLKEAEQLIPKEATHIIWRIYPELHKSSSDYEYCLYMRLCAYRDEGGVPIILKIDNCENINQKDMKDSE